VSKSEQHQRWLEALVAKLGGDAGTVHVQVGEDLHLTAAHNIPPPVLAIVEHVSHGKGMAGAAQVKKGPVRVCNLQTDQSGTVKPGAKAVGAQTGIALPVLDGDAVFAVVGIAWMDERELTDADEQSMMQLAAALPR
jgi:L-methionine (R)-S-oxide reductase